MMWKKINSKKFKHLKAESIYSLTSLLTYFESLKFFLWTTIMATNKTASARSKEYFNKLKNLIFKGTKNINE